VPTVIEAGVDFVLLSWVGIIGPKGLPEADVRTFNGWVNDALNDPATQKKFADIGFVAEPGTPEAFRERIVKDLELWRSVAKRIKVNN
jgi:tripartite-type tricarboxylate transporter receptor subunit TctC